jgi:hypothetical protein
MKTTLVTIAVLLLLLFQFAQVAALGEMKKRADQDRTDLARHKDADQLRGYLDLVDRFSVVAKDRSQSGVAAVLYAHEVGKTLPPDEQVAYYTNLLPEVKDDAVRRSIRFKLVDLYLHDPKPDRAKAMEQLRLVITEMPAASANGPTTAPSLAADGSPR